MNIREYIESGIIEEFVMGVCSEQEAREVMAYAKQYPEIQAEIEAVEATIMQIAESSAPAPKEKTKEELFEKLFTEIPSIDTKKSEPISIAFTPKTKQKTFNTNYLIAASIALLISTALNILLYSRWKVSEDQLIALNHEKQEFASIMASQKNNYAELEKQMHMINSASVVQVKLAGLPMMPDASAMVYYNTESKEVYIHIGKLPAAPEDKQYQLWAIVDGKPVDAGVFDADAFQTGMLQMKNSNMPVTFAVTIEKKGGSSIPTMEQMVLAGNMPS